MGAAAKLLQHPLDRLDQFSHLLDAIKDVAVAKVHSYGREAAARAVEFVEEHWEQLGHHVGKVVGQVLFEVILAVASDFLVNLVEEAVAVAGRLAARAVAGAAELMRSVGRLIGEALEAIRGLGRRLSGELGELMAGVERLGQSLMAALDELAGEGVLLGDTGVGVQVPVPKGGTVVESRAVKPPRTSPAATDISRPGGGSGGGAAASGPKKPATTAADVQSGRDVVRSGEGPLVPGQSPLGHYGIDTYGSNKKRIGDGLEGHEVLQNAWLEANGHGARGSAVSQKNPMLALTESEHRARRRRGTCAARQRLVKGAGAGQGRA